jgi:hypothetical protein
MSGIRDQRLMFLQSEEAGVADVEMFIRAWAASPRFRGFPERGWAKEWQESAEVIVAYISDGRWVADCAFCAGGIACWPDGGMVACMDCGTTYQNVDYPTPRQIRDVERVLAARPRGMMDWHRQRGETMNDLKAQNLMHGYPPVET